MNYVQKYFWLLTQLILISCRELEESVVSEQSNRSEGESNESETGRVNVICSFDKLTVRGNNVNISTVLNATCLDEAKYIEVCALNYLFIDADIDRTGQNVQLSLSAKIWQIIGKRKFILDGKSGGEYSPQYASDGMDNFRHGKPGKPGVSGGRFFGIADKFINEHNLKIYMNGGVGGSGQHGGRGSNGVNGQDPPVPENSTVAISVFQSGQFYYENTMNNNVTDQDGGITQFYKSFRVFGRNGTKPVNGGNGGVGGLGGHSGDWFIFSLHKSPNISIFAKSGDNGAPGKGAASGNTSRNGYTLDVLYQDKFDLKMNKSLSFGKPSPMIHEEIIITGENGTDGINDDGIEYPDAVVFIDPSHIINNYKNFIRENLAMGDKKSELQQFLEDLDANEHIQSLYDTLGLVDDLRALETQYFQLKNNLFFIPFIESLLNRTEKYANNFTEPGENKEILNWLHSVLTKKMGIVKSLTNPTLIVNLPKYFNDIQVQAYNLKHHHNEEDTNDQQNHFLNNEVQSAINFIKFQVLPKIENTFAEISSQVENLIEELYDRQYKYKQESVDIDDKTMEDIKNGIENDPNLNNLTSLTMMLHDKMFQFKLINSVFEVEENVMMISKENELIKDYLGDSFYLSSPLNEPSFEMNENVREKCQLFLEQLTDIEHGLKTFSQENAINDLKGIIQKVSEVIDELQNGLKLNKYDVDQKRNELIKFFKEKQLELQPFKNVSSQLEICLAILHLEEISIDFYRQMPIQDISKILNSNAIVNKMKEEALKLNSDIENIYDTIFHRFDEVEVAVNEISKNLINKSQLQLDISRWNVQSTIRNWKAFFRQIGNETAIKEILYRNIEKLEDSVQTLIDIHEYINDFTYVVPEKSQYSHHRKLNDAVVNLKTLIDANIVFDMYDLAVNAFATHRFPFENILLSELKLPTGLQPSKNGKFIRVVIDHIDVLKEKSKNFDVSNGKYDRLFFNDVEFSSSETSVTGPFFTWKYSEVKDEVVELLRGKEVLLTADINKAEMLNAVKFNDIGIQLKTKNADTQKALSDALANFTVSMTMVAKNYYRCYSEIYSFILDENVCIISSFKRHPNGQPIIRNEVYRKLSEMHYFLSPYTTWKIQLLKIGDSDLSKFEKESIQLELAGQGQYIQNVTMLSEICKR